MKVVGGIMYLIDIIVRYFLVAVFSIMWYKQDFSAWFGVLAVVLFISILGGLINYFKRVKLLETK